MAQSGTQRGQTNRRIAAPTGQGSFSSALARTPGAAAAVADTAAAAAAPGFSKAAGAVDATKVEFETGELEFADNDEEDEAEDEAEFETGGANVEGDGGEGHGL